MNKRERHEIAVTVRAIIEDECDEIRSKYEKLFGSLKGLRNYVRKECVEIWSNNEPYFDDDFLPLDMEWIQIGKKFINLDGVWCLIRDGLKFDLVKGR